MKLNTHLANEFIYIKSKYDIVNCTRKTIESSIFHDEWKYYVIFTYMTTY